MPYAYCRSCEAEMDPPTFAQVLKLNGEAYTCMQCGETNDPRMTPDQVLGEMVTQMDGYSHRLAQLEGMQERIETLERHVLELQNQAPVPQAPTAEPEVQQDPELG